jgi:hypothetical protein
VLEALPAALERRTVGLQEPASGESRMISLGKLNEQILAIGALLLLAIGCALVLAIISQ